jgi:hypothetical protein
MLRYSESNTKELSATVAKLILLLVFATNVSSALTSTYVSNVRLRTHMLKCML